MAPDAAFPSSDGAYRRKLKLFAGMAFAQFLLAAVSLYVSSITRAYVAGESLWSKGERDAIYFLNLYADAGKPENYEKFLRALDVPLGDLDARRALDASWRNVAEARAGFLRGGNHPDDINPMIGMYICCRALPYLHEAIDSWRGTDATIEELQTLGASIKAERAEREISEAEGQALEARIEDVNHRAAPRADEFSDALGAGSRALSLILLGANFLVMVGLIAAMARALRPPHRPISPSPSISALSNASGS